MIPQEFSKAYVVFNGHANLTVQVTDSTTLNLKSTRDFKSNKMNYSTAPGISKIQKELATADTLFVRPIKQGYHKSMNSAYPSGADIIQEVEACSSVPSQVSTGDASWLGIGFLNVRLSCESPLTSASPRHNAKSLIRHSSDMHAYVMFPTSRFKIAKKSALWIFFTPISVINWCQIVKPSVFTPFTSAEGMILNVAWPAMPNGDNPVNVFDVILCPLSIKRLYFPDVVVVCLSENYVNELDSTGQQKGHSKQTC